MTEVFADTFYWLAMLNVDDAYHDQVVATPSPGQLVTTWAVQLEVMDAFSEQRFRPLALVFWEQSNQDPELVLIPLDTQLLGRAATLFANRRDKNWSFSNCISFEVMRERNITTALPRDRHFEQAGFRAFFR